MSHNKTTVNNEEPDLSGNIPLNLDSYITESNIQNNEVVKYDGSDWINSAISSSLSLNLKVGFHYDNLGWSQSAKLYGIGDYYIARDQLARNYNGAGFDFNNATSTNTPQSNTRWFESVDIPDAGKYLFIYSIQCRNGTSLTVRCSNNAGDFGVKCISKRFGFQSPFVFGIADCVNNDIFKVVVKAKSGSPAIMTTKGMKVTSLQIFKLE